MLVLLAHVFRNGTVIILNMNITNVNSVTNSVLIDSGLRRNTTYVNFENVSQSQNFDLTGLMIESTEIMNQLTVLNEATASEPVQPTHPQGYKDAFSAGNSPDDVY